MKKIVSFLKSLHLRQILSVLVIGTVLLFTTACNSGDIRGARPDNPPVQAGGNNNPHSMGGDGYTNYKSSTDPSVNRSNQHSDASLIQSLGNTLIATSAADYDSSDILYPGAKGETGVQGQRLYTEKDGTRQLPARRQESINRSDPDEGIMESIGEQFKDASQFLKDNSDSAAGKAIANEKAKTDGPRGRDTIMDKSY